jgi:putative transposase
MIEPGNARLTVSRQCELLGMSRSGYYYRPEPLSEEDARLIDEEYTRHPFSERGGGLAGHPGACWSDVTGCSLMQQLGVAAICEEALSLGNGSREVSYLLSGLSIRLEPRLVQRHHVHPLRGGFVYLVAGWTGTADVLSWDLSITWTRSLRRR